MSQSDPVFESLKKISGKEPGSFLRATPTDAAALYWVSEDSPAHWYIVSSGFSKFGFELSIRIARNGNEENPHQWVQHYMDDLFAYVSSTGSGFVDQDFMEYTDKPLEHTGKTTFVGSVFVLDPVLGNIKTKEGDIPVFQVYFITGEELPKVQSDDYAEFFKKIKETTGEKYINDLDRKPTV